MFDTVSELSVVRDVYRQQASGVLLRTYQLFSLLATSKETHDFLGDENGETIVFSLIRLSDKAVS